jgi:hypothetical protein
MTTPQVISADELDKQSRIARRYANLIGTMPATFSTAIKELMIDDNNQLSSLSERTEFQVGRVLRGPTALSLIYWASKTFCPDKMPPGWIYSSLQIARFYSPSTLASILAYTYLVKRVKRIVNPDEWQFISEPLQKNLEICALLGWHLPEVGSTHALLGGGMLNLAYACYSAHDCKGYAEYRRFLKMKKLLQNSEYEITTWGCTSVEIAAQIILLSGFGIPLAHQFVEGFRGPEPTQNALRAKNPFFVVRRWLQDLAIKNSSDSESKTQNGNNPEIASVFTPDLTEKINLIQRNGSLHHWLEKGAQDINPDKSPDLLFDEVLFK